MNARRAPQRIPCSSAGSTRAELRVDLRSPTQRARLPTPVAAKSRPGANAQRGSVRNRSRRPHQPETRGQADHSESATERRKRGRSDGGTAAKRRRDNGRAQGREETGEEVAEDIGRLEGNADADRRQETGQGDSGEEAGRQAAAEVGIASTMASRKLQTPGSSCFEDAPPISKSCSVIREDHFGKTRMTVPGASPRV
jgi:hypothetical protein